MSQNLIIRLALARDEGLNEFEDLSNELQTDLRKEVPPPVILKGLNAIHYWLAENSDRKGIDVDANFQSGFDIPGVF